MEEPETLKIDIKTVVISSYRFVLTPILLD
jgi:hypothetical protein